MHKLSTFLKTLNGLITSILFISFVLIFLLITIKDFRSNYISIEPFEIPSNFENENYTGKTLAIKFTDNIYDIERTANSKAKGIIFIPVWDQTKIDIKFSESGVSYSSLIKYLKNMVGIQQTSIRGELTAQGNSLNLTVHITGKPPKSFLGEKTEIEKLLKESSEYTCECIQPYILSAYYYVTEDNIKKEKTLKTIHAVLINNSPEDDSWAYTLWGNVLREQNSYDEALSKYQSAINLNPKFAIAYTNIAGVYCDKNDYPNAIKFLNKAKQIDSKNPTIYLIWGSILDDSNEPEKAVEKYKLALNLNLTILEKIATYTSYATVLIELKKYDEAIYYLKKANDLDPQSPYVFSAWGLALEQKGAINEAYSRYQEGLAIDPYFLNIYVLLNSLLIKQHRFQEAIQNYKQAIKLYPGIAELHVMLGDALCKKGNFNEGFLQFKKANMLNKRLISPYTYRAIQCFGLGKDKEAIEFFNEVENREEQNKLEFEKHRITNIEKYRFKMLQPTFSITIDKRLAEAYYDWGLLLDKQKDYPTALIKYKKALTHDSKIAGAYANMAIDFDQIGDHSKAIQHYKKAAELDSNMVEIYFNWGESLEEHNDLKGAVEKYKKAIELKPNFLSSYINLGNIYANSQDYDKAEKLYCQALALSPNFEIANLNYANVLFRKGNINKAIFYLQKTAKLKNLKTRKQAQYFLKLIQKKNSDSFKFIKLNDTYLNANLRRYTFEKATNSF